MPYPDPTPIPDFWKRLRRLVPIGDGWVKVVGFKPDVYPEATGAQAMAEFNGSLYVAVDHKHGLRVWRTTTGTKWQEVVGPKGTTSAGFGKMNCARGLDMAVHDGILYLATDVGLWLTKDGTAWQQPTEPTLINDEISALAAFGTHVYAATGTTVWRGSGKTGWELVVGDQASAKTKSGFGDPDISDLSRFAVFDGKLYAGAGMDSPLGTKGIAVWRTIDGVNWEEFKRQTGTPGSLHVQAMVAFGGHLYVGGYHVLRVYRTDGTLGNWTDVTDGIDTGGSNDAARAVAVFRNTLYLGAMGAAAGKILWKSTDGKAWSLADTKLIGTDKDRVKGLIGYDDYLYLTTHRTYPGPKYPDRHKLEIWRYGLRYAPEDPFVRFFKPFAARLSIIRIPPPPVLLRTVRSWIGTLGEKIRNLMGRT